MDFDLHFNIEKMYEEPVHKANFRMLMIPESSNGQKVSDLQFSCSVEHSMHTSKNLFGFEIIHYYTEKPFSVFWFYLTAKIQKEKSVPHRTNSLTPKEEYEKINAIDFFLENSTFLSSTNQGEIGPFNDIAFPDYAGEIQVYDFLRKLNLFIYQLKAPEREYDDNYKTHSRERLYQICVSLFILICHKNKIPARYVSGYLGHDTDHIITTKHLHIWVEALIPGCGWIGFDPVNNREADYHYLKIAHDNNYDDCSPVIEILELTLIKNNHFSLTVTDQ